MSPDLLRQRRNLLLLSGGLILLDFAKVSVVKVSILGTELLIGDPSILLPFAWTIWGYFLLRYYQYLRAEGDLGILAMVKSLFEGRARTHVLTQTNRQHLVGEVTISRKLLRWNYAILEYDPAIGERKEREAGLLPIMSSSYWAARAAFHVLANTPKATDHVLPFLLAIMAPVVAILRSANYL